MPEVHTDTEGRRDHVDVFDFIEEAQNCHSYEAKLSNYQLNEYGDDKKHLEFIKFHKGLTELFERLPQFCWNFLDIPTLGNDTATSRYIPSMAGYISRADLNPAHLMTFQFTMTGRDQTEREMVHLIFVFHVRVSRDVANPRM